MSSHRSFHDLLGKQVSQNGSEIDSDAALTIGLIQTSIIGGNQAFQSPFGPRPMVYADWTASGRALDFVEDYMCNQVLPFYGNTHTTSSITGLQSTCYRLEARQIIAESVNAKITGRGAEDVVLFTGSGSTAAINKMVKILGLDLPLGDIPAEQR